MANRFLNLLAGLTVLISTSSGQAKTIAWNNTSGGNWSDNTSWKPKEVPGPSDIAVITKSGNYTVTLDVGASVGELILGAADGTTQTLANNGQTFTLSGSATINSGGIFDLSTGIFNGDPSGVGATLYGTLACAGGALAGKFIVASNSVLNLSSPNSLTSLVVLTNYGTVNWISGDLSGVSNPQIINYGLWNVETNARFTGGSGGAVFNNYGIFRKSAGSGTTTFDTNTTFNTTGLVDLQAGGLQIYNGLGSGTFNISNNAQLTFVYTASPTPTFYTLFGDSTFSGSGLLQGGLAGSNAVVNGSLTLNNLSLSGSVTIASNTVVTLTATSSVPPEKFYKLLLTNYGTVLWSNVNLAATTSDNRIRCHQHESSAVLSRNSSINPSEFQQPKAVP